MLKIGFDAKRLFNNYTGLGNYSRTLVSNMQLNFPDNEYFLYSPSAKNNAQTENFFSDSFNIIKPNHFFKSYWRTFGVVNNIIADDLDIYHGLSHELPIGAEKSRSTNIVTVHDLLYLLYPDGFSIVDRKIYDLKFRYACRVADRIIAISESTKNDIVTYFGVDPEKISVVYQTCSDIYKSKISQQEIDILTKKYQLPNQYLLYVGSIIERKNLLSIVKAIHSLKTFLKIPLVVIGKGDRYKEKVKDYVKKNGLEQLVFFLDNVATQDMPCIYFKSKIFIYPSVYEGFGIPLIEALYTRTPVITSNTSSLPEAAGNGAHYVNPNDVSEIADAIIRLLTNKDYYTQLINNGFAYVQKFKSELLSNQLISLYNSAIIKK